MIHRRDAARCVCRGGATVGETFKALYDNWSKVVPLGEYPQIGIGGHVAGGAFGLLCRQLGLTADYFYPSSITTFRIEFNNIFHHALSIQIGE